MLCVIAPFDQRYVVPAPDVSVTLPPAQKVVEPDVIIEGLPGKALTVSVAGSEVIILALLQFEIWQRYW